MYFVKFLLCDLFGVYGVPTKLQEIDGNFDSAYVPYAVGSEPHVKAFGCNPSPSITLCVSVQCCTAVQLTVDIGRCSSLDCSSYSTLGNDLPIPETACIYEGWKKAETFVYFQSQLAFMTPRCCCVYCRMHHPFYGSTKSCLMRGLVHFDFASLHSARTDSDDDDDGDDSGGLDNEGKEPNSSTSIAV